MKYVLQANITKAETSNGYKLIGLYDYGYVGSDSDNDIISSAKQIVGTDNINVTNVIIDDGQDDIQQSCVLLASGDI